MNQQVKLELKNSKTQISEFMSFGLPRAFRALHWLTKYSSSAETVCYFQLNSSGFAPLTNLSPISRSRQSPERQHGDVVGLRGFPCVASDGFQNSGHCLGGGLTRMIR